jgi:5'-methylthioinosine phosphorylase
LIVAIDLAVIGGTGLYGFPGLERVERRDVATPFGAPSAAIVLGDFRGKRLAFLARHGEQHTLAPHRVNYRANVKALHDLGARRILGVNAVGGIHADMGPRTLVVPEQIIDYTHGRLSSFCDVDGAKVEHIDFSEPYSVAMRAAVIGATKRAKIDVFAGGCYATTQGPRLETAAEIARLRRDGCDLVGMTGMPEAVLARELGVEYACLALVANWAAGCGSSGAGGPTEPISLPEIFANLEAAMAQVPTIIAQILTAS